MRPLRQCLYLIPFLLVACSSKDLQKTIDVFTEFNETPPTQSEVIAGLKQALILGISKGSEQAAKLDGYYRNPQLKIAFPPDARKAEKNLRNIGLGSEVDRFVRQLNRGAETAAAKAKPIFIDAIKSMTIEDAFSILYGESNAATNYLRKTTSAKLKTGFLPVISKSLDEVNATRYYDDIVKRYNKIPLVKKVNPNLDDYATDRAIDGLFLLIAREEASIRADPLARTSELLKHVFGSLDS
jgi:hypothetical protein